MVVELSIETIKANKETGRFVDNLRSYTVRLDNHRILTVSTSSVKMATKWLNSVLKSPSDNTSGEIFVGVSVDRCSKMFPCSDPRDSPYDLLQLCTGCHCLLYKLHDRNSDFSIPKDFNLFFENSRVSCVGMNIEFVAKILLKHHGIKIENAVDLGEYAIKGMKRDDLDLGQYDLDQLAVTVIGKEMDVMRPENKIKWYDDVYFHGYADDLSLEKIQFATVDAYLCFLIGSQLFQMIQSQAPSASSSRSRIKKRKKDKKIKKDCSYSISLHGRTSRFDFFDFKNSQ